jgi:acetoacetate decarboxylase
MGFVKSAEEILARLQKPFEFYDVERLILAWETRADIVRALLPPPLTPSPRPIAFGYLASMPRTSFGPGYLEAGLFLRAEFHGEPGQYCLSMPVTDDMAMALGREALGMPKKMARIALRRDGTRVAGWVERHGVRFCEMRARLTGTFNTEDAGDVAGLHAAAVKSVAVSFSFKHFPAPDRMHFDYPPRLIRRETEFQSRSTEVGEGEIVFHPSQFDPWSELEVVRMLGAVYATGTIVMDKGTVVDEVDAMAFVPYAFLKWDF